MNVDSRWFTLILRPWYVHLRVGVVMVGADLDRSEEQYDARILFTVWRSLP